MYKISTFMKTIPAELLPSIKEAADLATDIVTDITDAAKTVTKTNMTDMLKAPLEK